MNEAIKSEEIVDDKGTTEDWELYVRSEVQSLVDTFLPVSVHGDVGISYKRLAEGFAEGGAPIFNEKKVVGVTVLLSFDFEDAIDKPI